MNSEIKHGNRFIDLTGKKYNNLFVVKWISVNNRKGTTWECKCDCGNECIVNSADLRKSNTRSCGCYWEKQTKKLPYHWLYSSLKCNSKQRKCTCELTFDQFLEFTKISKCCYCGDDIEWYEHSIKNKKHSPQRYNLDRKDNNKGYTVDNCVVCCKLCNKIKSNIFSYEEMIEVGKILSRRIKKD